MILHVMAGGVRVSELSCSPSDLNLAAPLSKHGKRGRRHGTLVLCACAQAANPSKRRGKKSSSKELC